MATSIARLAVFLEADSSRLARDLDKAKKELKEWQDKVSGKTKPGAFSGAQFGGVFSFLGQGHARAFVALQGPLGVAAGLALTLVHKLIEVAKALDVVGKEADRLGIATQTLQSLQHAGSLAGVSTEELTNSLDRFQRTLGAANSGSLEARRLFEDLGLSAQRLATQRLDESFGDIAEALSQVSNRTERARLTFELFGRQSARLDALLGGGRAGIREARRELNTLGALRNRAQIRDVERMNDAATTLGTGLRGAFERFTVEIAPSMTRLLHNITPAVVLLSDALAALGNTLGQVITLFNTVFFQAPRLIGELTSGRPLSPQSREQLGGPGALLEHQRGLLRDAERRAGTRPPLPGNAGYNPELLSQLTGLRFPTINEINQGRFDELNTTPISAQRDLARRALQEAGQLINSQRLSGAFQEGSSGAISAVNRFRIANSQQDRVVAAIEAGHRIQEQQRRELEDIRRILATGAFAQATF